MATDDHDYVLPRKKRKTKPEIEQETAANMRDLIDQNEVLRTQNAMLEDMPNLSKATNRQLLEEMHARLFHAKSLEHTGKSV